MQTNISFRILTSHGDNLLDQAVCFGTFFWCFSRDFRSTWGILGENHLGSRFFFFSDFGMPKRLFSWNSKVKHHSFSEISPSARFSALPFWGRPAPPAAAWEICQNKPRSDQTSRLQYLQFSEACQPEHHFRAQSSRNISNLPNLPNLPNPLFQTFPHLGHLDPNLFQPRSPGSQPGPRFRQIFGCQIAPQWGHRHRDQGPNVLRIRLVKTRGDFCFGETDVSVFLRSFQRGNWWVLGLSFFFSGNSRWNQGNEFPKKTSKQQNKHLIFLGVNM